MMMSQYRYQRKSVISDTNCSVQQEDFQIDKKKFPMKCLCRFYRKIFFPQLIFDSHIDDRRASEIIISLILQILKRLRMKYLNTHQDIDDDYQLCI